MLDIQNGVIDDMEEDMGEECDDADYVGEFSQIEDDEEDEEEYDEE